MERFMAEVSAIADNALPERFCVSCFINVKGKTWTCSSDVRQIPGDAER